MKRVTNHSWILLALAAAFVACEREGIKDLYIEKPFVPIRDVRGEAGYGKATFAWTAPDSASSLFYTELIATNALPGSEPWRLVIPRNLDSLLVTDMPGGDYSFLFVSHAASGESVEVATLSLSVQSWDLEPPATILDFTCLSAENTLLAYWQEPVHATYDRVVFEIYRQGALLRSESVEKGSTGEILLPDLDYHADYELRYYSASARDIRSESRAVAFSTGGAAPAVPEILPSTSRVDYAHSGEITWTVSAEVDSLLVRFIDLNGENRLYRFGGARGREYLSLLPGGTVELRVQARGTDGTWSLPRPREIKTRLADETYSLKVPNCLSSQDQRLSKLSERYYQALGRGTQDDYRANPESAIYTFQEMATLREITLDHEIINIDELELLVNLETLRVNAGNPGRDNCPQVEYFLRVIDRLPRVREVLVHANYPRHDQLKQELENSAKVTFRTL
ncbi:MAG: hypothetical protein LBK12_02370 [Odoribacteraceae bacterium]|jgi:hypothetical protein|nr:hypothetical protein [Odoribacteraceae bacterium]